MMRRFLVLVALALVVAVGAAGYALVSCSTDENDAVSVRVDPDRETRLQVPDGPLIVLPAGSTSGPGQLVAEELPETPALPDGIISATGGGRDIRLEGAELTGQATLRFPVEPPGGVPTEAVDALLTYYDRDQQEWVPVESEYDGQTVTATVDHLSWWNPITWDYQGLLDAAASRFAGFATPPEPDQPRCPNEDLARADGTSVTSDSDGPLKWCYGESDGDRMLRLVNGRGYPALVSHPEGWDLQRQRPDSMAQAIGARVIEAVEALPDGRSGILLGGGQMVTLFPEQPLGTTAFVDVKPSSGAFILGSLEYAGSTVGFVADKIPGARRDTRLSAAKYGSCATELADTVGAAGVDDDFAGLESELVAESLRCVARQAVVETVYEEFLLSAIEWLADGSRQIVAGGRGIIDTLQPPYRITITVPGEGAAQDQYEQTTPVEVTETGDDDSSCGTVTWEQFDLDHFVYEDEGTTCDEALEIAQEYFNGSPPLANMYGAVSLEGPVEEWDCGAKQAEEPYVFCGPYEGGGGITLERIVSLDEVEQRAIQSREQAVPQDLLGDWSGTIYHDDAGESYQANLSIEGGFVGEQVGTIYYPYQECTSTLELKLVSDNSIVVSGDQISKNYDNPHQCPASPGGREALRLLANGSLQFGLDSAEEKGHKRGYLTR